MTTKDIIWDLPTRIFHWLFVTSFIIAWITYDDNRYLFVHVYSGYVFLSLLGFRFLWGVIGTHYAQFHSFAYNWSSVTAYLKGLITGQAMRHIGHNPIGGWVIFIMLALGVLVGTSGLITFGGEEGHGPLKGIVSFGVGIISREAHEILAWTMLAVTIVHLLGVIFESISHKENLIWSMVTGKKGSLSNAIGVKKHHLIGLLLVTTIFISALIYFKGYLTETADDLYQPFVGPVLPDNETWREECGECHYAYHPTLLPERSWRLIFKNQNDHFDDDLDLDAETLSELLGFHTQYSSESGLSEPARKITFYTPADKTPIRITETPYWLKKHDEIDNIYWKHEKVKSKGNCAACHLDANKGTYEDSNMRLPEIENTGLNNKADR